MASSQDKSRSIPGGRDDRRKTRETRRSKLESIAGKLWSDIEPSLIKLSDEEASSHIPKELSRLLDTSLSSVHPTIRREVNRKIRQLNTGGKRSVARLQVTHEIVRPSTILSEAQFRQGNVQWSFQEFFWRTVDQFGPRESPVPEVLLGLLTASVIADGVFDVESLLRILQKLVVEQHKISTVGDEVVLPLESRSTARFRSFYSPSATTLGILYRIRNSKIGVSDVDALPGNLVGWLSTVFPVSLDSGSHDETLRSFVDIAIWDLCEKVELPFLATAMAKRTLDNYDVSLESWITALGGETISIEQQPSKSQEGISVLVSAKEPFQDVETLDTAFRELFDGISDRELYAPEIEKRFLKLDQTLSQPGPQLLLDWFRFKYSQFGGGVVPSTLERYYTAIGKIWLVETFELEAEEIDAELHFEVSQHIANRPNDADYASGVFSQFLDFLIDNDVGSEVSFTKKSLVSRSGPRRDLVWGFEFVALLKRIEESDCVSSLDRKTMAAISLLAFRGGLRRREIYALRMQDIVLTDEEIILRRRPNIFLRGKTASSERRLHLSWLMPFEEREFIRRWIVRERLGPAEDRRLVRFRQLGVGRTGYAKAIRAISLMLKEITGRPVVFHTLRHSAVNWWYCLIHDEALLAQLFCKEPVGLADNVSQPESALIHDRGWIVSNHAGHINPASTSRAYLKLNDVIVSQRMRRYWESNLDIVRVRKLTGMNKRKAEAWFADDSVPNYLGAYQSLRGRVLSCRDQIAEVFN